MKKSMAKWNFIQKITALPLSSKRLKFWDKQAPEETTEKVVQKRQSSRTFRKNRFKPSLPGRYLIFETTGCCLTAAVAKSSFMGKLEFTAVAESRAITFNDAVTEVVDNLRASVKGRLPKKAVLITPSAASELLYLPVDPANKKAAQQINEMVRWELEELLVAQNDIWSLGALLQGMGKVDSEQRTRIEERAGRGLALNTAFEDVASRDDIDKCLELQQQLLGEEGELLTSAVALPDEDQFDQFTWWGGGISETVCMQWSKAFKQNKLDLVWVYPQLGAPLPLLAQETKGWMLVDIQQEQYALYQVRGGQLNSAGQHVRQPGLIDVNELERHIRSLLHTDTEFVYLAAPLVYGAHAKELEQLVNRRVILLAQSEYFSHHHSSNPAVSSAMRGVGLHVLGRVIPKTLVRIKAQEPKAPLWKNKDLWPWVGIGIVLAGVISVEMYLRTEAEKKEWALDLATIEFTKRKELQQLAQQNRQEVSELQGVLAQKEKKLKEIKHFRVILNDVIYYRQNLAPGLLEVIRNSVNEYVMIDSLEENRDSKGFYLEGWAVSDTQGQLFVGQLNRELAAWKYKVEEVQLVKGKGPFQMNGFFIKIWLVKTGQAGGSRK